MRIILPGALLLSASALLGCSSPSVPSWAVATTKSQYIAEKPLVGRVWPTKPSVASQKNDAEADGRKIDDAKIHNVKVDAPASAASTLAPDDPRKALKELDQRQAEENRKIDAAL
ncbi:MAG: hypothetical protein WA851_04770, partial [Xanthobacteraceae bacterium]